VKHSARSCFFLVRGTICLAVALLLCCFGRSAKDRAVSELLPVKKQVEDQLKNRMDDLNGQVAAFARTVAGDRDFSMKVLVDKDRSAPEVTEIAPRYMEPMALSVLSIVNSRDTVLSCGQFPASAGAPSPVAGLPGGSAAFVMDNVKGATVLTLQAKARFAILDSVFFAIGGVIVDQNFCSHFSLPQGFRLVCKQGGTVTGALGGQHVESISDVKDSVIVLNNASYPAVSITLPYAGSGPAPCLVIMSDKPL
jgi:hypothetical protein